MRCSFLYAATSPDIFSATSGHTGVGTLESPWSIASSQPVQSTSIVLRRPHDLNGELDAENRDLRSCQTSEFWTVPGADSSIRQHQQPQRTGNLNSKSREDVRGRDEKGNIVAAQMSEVENSQQSQDGTKLGYRPPKWKSATLCPYFEAWAVLAHPERCHSPGRSPTRIHDVDASHVAGNQDRYMYDGRIHFQESVDFLAALESFNDDSTDSLPFRFFDSAHHCRSQLSPRACPSDSLKPSIFRTPRCRHTNKSRDAGTQTRHCSSSWNAAHVMQQLRYLEKADHLQLGEQPTPAMLSSLAVCQEQDNQHSQFHHGLHRLELRLAPCWQDVADDVGLGEDASLQLSPLTTSPCNRSRLSMAPSSLSSLPSPLRRSGSFQGAAGISPDRAVSTPGASPPKTPVMCSLRRKTTVLSQRLLQRERQCIALKEALDFSMKGSKSVRGTGKVDRSIIESKGSKVRSKHFCHGGPREPLMPCENLF